MTIPSPRGCVPTRSKLAVRHGFEPSTRGVTWFLGLATVCVFMPLPISLITSVCKVFICIMWQLTADIRVSVCILCRICVGRQTLANLCRFVSECLQLRRLRNRARLAGHPRLSGSAHGLPPLAYSPVRFQDMLNATLAGTPGKGYQGEMPVRADRLRGLLGNRAGAKTRAGMGGRTPARAV